MTPSTRTSRLSLVLLRTGSLTLAQGLDPSTPSKEYLRLGGQIVAIENAPTVPAAIAQLSAATLTFGNQNVPTTSTSQSVTARFVLG